MWICGFRVTKTELVVFIVGYIVINYAILQMQLLPKRRPDDRRMLLDTAPNGWDLARGLQDGDLPVPPESVKYINPDETDGIEKIKMLMESSPQGWELAEGLQDGNLPTPPPQPPAPAPTEHKLVIDPAKTKVILFWNSFGYSDDYDFGTGTAPFHAWRCPVANCETTTDRSRLSEADVVMFHGPDIQSFPSERPQDQRYVLFQEEPYYELSDRNFPKYKDKFNLTITPRRDSDVVHLKGKILMAQKSKHHAPVNLKKRPKGVAWIAKHCHSSGKRELYVKELQKHIGVDIYGPCGKHKCKGGTYEECLQELEKQYKFIIAFERNACQDFVHRVFEPLRTMMIPIVYGSANYTELVPPKSVIDVTRFRSPKDLATRLKHLAKHENEYNSFFEWKSKGYLVVTVTKKLMAASFCGLCAILNDPFYQYKDYRDIHKWWVNGMCEPRFINRQQHSWHH